MKKIISLLLTVLLMFSVTGCNNNKPDPSLASDAIEGWQSNDFTKLIPAPTAGVFFNDKIEDAKYTAVLTDISTDETKEYAGRVKEYGFTDEAVEKDEESYYLYKAKNKDGIEVNIMIGMGYFSIEINK